ncbi:MAG: hypothetical protein AAGK78_14895, partial [Planctomycetota bacterium]
AAPLAQASADSDTGQPDQVDDIDDAGLDPSMVIPPTSGLTGLAYDGAFGEDVAEYGDDTAEASVDDASHLNELEELPPLADEPSHPDRPEQAVAEEELEPLDELPD